MDVTVGGELPINQLSDALRAEVAMAGWTEVLTWALISRAGALTRAEHDSMWVSICTVAVLCSVAACHCGTHPCVLFSIIRCSENFKSLGLEEGPVVGVGNPATAEFEVVRSTLLPGILKTLANNKDAALPLRYVRYARYARHACVLHSSFVLHMCSNINVCVCSDRTSTGCLS